MLTGLREPVPKRSYAEKEPPPIDGEVFVYSIEPDRTFRVYPKKRAQAKVVR